MPDSLIFMGGQTISFRERGHVMFSKPQQGDFCAYTSTEHEHRAVTKGRWKIQPK